MILSQSNIETQVQALASIVTNSTKTIQKDDPEHRQNENKRVRLSANSSKKFGAKNHIEAVNA